jgi:hypothetical protein
MGANFFLIIYVFRHKLLIQGAGMQLSTNCGIGYFRNIKNIFFIEQGANFPGYRDFPA